MHKKIDIAKIPAFLAVAKYLNFTEAAYELYTTQSNISKSIAALESSLGFPLFTRTNKKVALNPAGEFLYEQLEKKMFELDELFIEASKIYEGKKGSISIGFAGYLPKTPVFEVICSSFFSKHPEYDLDLKHMPYYELQKNLNNDRVDAILYNDLDISLSEKYKSLTLVNNETILLYNPHVFHTDEKKGFFDLRFVDKKFICISPSLVPGFYSNLMLVCKAYGFKPNITKYVDYMIDLVQYISNSDYITILSRALYPIKAPDLKYITIPQKDEMPSLETIIAWKEDNDNPALDYFLIMASEYLKNQ